jgi:hypothetical protein
MTDLLLMTAQALSRTSLDAVCDSGHLVGAGLPWPMTVATCLLVDAGTYNMLSTPQTV